MFQLTRFSHNTVFFRNQNTRYATTRCSFQIWQMLTYFLGRGYWNADGCWHGGGGVKNLQKSADVLYGRSQLRLYLLVSIVLFQGAAPPRRSSSMSSMSSLSPASSTTTESCIVEPAPTLVKTSTTPAIYGVLFCIFLLSNSRWKAIFLTCSCSFLHSNYFPNWHFKSSFSTFILVAKSS